MVMRASLTLYASNPLDEEYEDEQEPDEELFDMLIEELIESKPQHRLYKVERKGAHNG